jgi:hypothetical protein
MTKVLFLIGSPRGKKSTSFSFGKYLEEKLQEKDLEKSTLIVRSQLASDEKTEQMLNEINESDAIILLAPLYDDCQPYIIVQLMELIATKNMNLKEKRFLPIINCGLSESIHITAVAIPIYKKFAKTVGFKWSGSLAVQAGEMFRGKLGLQMHELGKEANIMRGILDDLADAISLDADILDMAPKVLPKMFYWKFLQKLFAKMNTKGWRKAAVDKGEDPDAKPYLE